MKFQTMTNEVQVDEGWRQVARPWSASLYRRSQSLGELGPTFDGLSELCEHEALKYVENFDGHVYINPMWKLEATKDCSRNDFLALAKIVCVEWKMELNRIFGSGVVRKWAKNHSYHERVAVITGVIFIEGAFTHSKCMG
jgi:hypothetical protein